jgi:hypothetical protein
LATGEVSASCKCATIFEQPSGFAGNFLLRLTLSFGLKMSEPVGGDPIPLPALGNLIETHTGWAVEVSNATGVEVQPGSWNGTLEQILTSMGSESGFDVSIDAGTDTISLSGI